MICNECAKRKCKTEAVYNKRTGRFSCKSYQSPRRTFNFLELVMESSPKDTLDLLYRHKLRVIETKKGLQVRYDKRK